VRSDRGDPLHIVGCLLRGRILGGLETLLDRHLVLIGDQDAAFGCREVA
jgi:hypothetical protein